MYVRVDEELSPNLEEEEVDCDSSDGEDENETVKKEEQEKQDPSSTYKKQWAHKPFIKSARRDNPKYFIMGNLDEGIQVRQTSRRDMALLSRIEPKNINEAYEYLHWNKTM